MKQTNETAGVVVGKASPAIQDVCRLLARQGISTVVVPKETPPPDRDEPAVVDHINWSGQPGQDLFFNGWKLMF